MTEKVIYLIQLNEPDGDDGVVYYEWCDDPAPTIYHDPKQAIKYIKDDGEIQELLSVIKDCLSYADAKAVLSGGEAVELREKCRAVIEKFEDSDNANT